MNQATPGQAGLALGAWGAVQATAAGSAMALGCIVRDVIQLAMSNSVNSDSAANQAVGYLSVYAVEICLLLVTIAVLIPLIRRPDSGRRANMDAGNNTTQGMNPNLQTSNRSLQSCRFVPSSSIRTQNCDVLLCP